MSGPPPLPNQAQAQARDQTGASARLQSEEYADIQMLRARAQRESTKAMKLRHKSAHQVSLMEDYRHKSTILKEKAVLMRERIPLVEEKMKELEDELRTGAQAVGSGGVRPRDQSRLHVKIRRLQEKIVALQRKSTKYESRAATMLSISSQKKVKADFFEEQARKFDYTASSYSSRADMLQRATEGNLTGSSRR